MSPMIDLTEATFRRLQARATAFVDTPESVIVRLLDATDGQSLGSVTNAQSTNAAPARSVHAGARIGDPSRPDDLTHTKLIRGTVGSEVADKWNELIVAAHREALRKLGTIDAVKAASQSSLATGRRDDSGFHFQPELNLSLQYVDANKAWHQVLHLAKRIGVPVEVEFWWREKDGAAFPGQYGVMRWSPAN